MAKIELLAPAGDLEKLKIAIEYGADAVYCGGELFGLRAGAKNFSPVQLAEAAEFVHARGKQLHLTMNIFAHNEDLSVLETYLKEIATIPIDAFIISDPGILRVIKRVRPDAVLHLSTQANTTNYEAACFWHAQGVSRIVLAREMSLAEIKTLRENTPKELELEAFVHGAMCISYSGRCLLSNFMVDRDANHGECAHPCRWNYSLVEEKRPGEYYPVIEDEKGTYIFNSKDLCMIEHIPQLIEAGVNSFKIEGRTKSVFYTATVVSAYRRAIDSYQNDPDHYTYQPAWMEEAEKASHRLFSTGFYFGKPDQDGQNYETSQYVRDFTFVGVVKSYDSLTGIATIEQRNKMSCGEVVEFFGPDGTCFEQTLDCIWNTEGDTIEAAPHPQQTIMVHTLRPVAENFMVRKPK